MSEPVPAPAASAAPSAPASPMITFDDFAKLDLRVGVVVEAKDHPNADKLLVLKVDIGSEQRQIVAGIRGHYQAADLVGRRIVIVANLAPRKMRGEESQGMLLAGSNEDKSKVIVISPSADIEAGARVS